LSGPHAEGVEIFVSVLKICPERCDGCGICADVCPFAAITWTQGRPEFNENCRACPICREECPADAIYTPEGDAGPEPTGSAGVMVAAELRGEEIEPVTLELIAEAQRLARHLSWPVHCVIFGAECDPAARELLRYGVDTVQLYQEPALGHFRPVPCTDVLEDAVRRLDPAVLLMAGTPVGRSLAPRLAARLRTGLTADCTSLEITGDGRLLQTRPAYGGDIMATIETPTGRPQMATVRPGVMPPAEPVESPGGEIVHCDFSPSDLRTRVTATHPAPEAETIADAEIVVAAGRGVKQREDLDMLESLARALGGMVGCTRPLVEAGWLPSVRQVGLSGRTVRPRLYIACGINGAIQHVAGMRSSDVIVAVNQDEDAPIMEVAHYALVGDLYEVIPGLLRAIEEGGDAHVLSGSKTE